MSTSSATKGRTAFALVCGAAAAGYLTVGLVQGSAAVAIAGTAVMIGFGAILLLFGRRNEPMSLLSGRVHDERQAQVMLRANAITGQVLAGVVVVAAFVSLAVGSHLAVAFMGVGAVGGITFTVATIWYSRRG